MEIGKALILDSNIARPLWKGRLCSDGVFVFRNILHLINQKGLCCWEKMDPFIYRDSLSHFFMCVVYVCPKILTFWGTYLTEQHFLRNWKPLEIAWSK